MPYSIDIAREGSQLPIAPGVPATAALVSAGSAQAQGSSEQASADTVGEVVGTGTQDGISVTYDPVDRNVDFVNTDKGTVAVAAHIAASPSDPHADRAFATALMATHNATADVHQIADVAGLQNELDLAPFESTGTVTGFALSVFSSTQVTIAAGTAIFVDFTAPAAPLQSKVVMASTNLTITAIGSQFVTYIGLNSAGAYVQQSTTFTPLQRRTVTPIGIAAHANLTSITAVVSQVASLHATGNQLHDLLEALGPLNITGNVYGPNGANLSLNRSAGIIFKFGANNNYDDPHNLAITGTTAGNIFYHTSTGTIAGPGTTINVTQFESPLGTLATVSNNKYTIQRIYMPQTGLTRIGYGQAEYASMEDAIAGLDTEVYVTEPTIATTAMLRAYMIVKKSATNASNTATVRFFPIGKFGAASGGGVAALTSANIIAALGYTPATSGDIATAISTHSAAVDPHGDRAFATAADTAAIAAHVALADPHPTYETSAEAAAKITAHVAASDPHGDRAFSIQRANHTGTQAWSTLTGTPTSLAGYGITDAQPLDTDLTALAALAATAGMLARTGAGTFAVRTLSSGTTAATWADPTGAAGNPTLSIANAVAAGASGLLTGTDKTKLDGLTAGAYVLKAGDTMTGALLGANGLVTLPQYAFSNDPDCGMYRVGTNSIGFAVAGAAAHIIDASGFHGFGVSPSSGARVEVSGGVHVRSTDKLSFTNTVNQTYVYASASNELSIGTNSVDRLVLTTTTFTAAVPVISNTYVAGGLPTTGQCRSEGGGASNTGFVSFYSPAGNRQGFIGFSTTNAATDLGTILYSSSLHQFSNTVITNGTLRATFDHSVDGSAAAGDVQSKRSTTQGVLWFGTIGNRYLYGNGTGAEFGPTFTQVRPQADNACDLGGGANRWGTVYAATGTINTSDQREKQDILPLDAAEKLVAQDIKAITKKFRWKDAVAEKGPQARTHVGWIAQEVRDAFVARGLDPSKYAMFCKDEWYEVPGPKPEGPDTRGPVTVDTPGAVKVTRFGLRHDQVLAFIVSTL